jgi:predicted NAD/FAD-dependent oxidoreductase
MNQKKPVRSFAVIGAGLAGLACARTLMQAGHAVRMFEQAPHVGGRIETSDTPFGAFDTGAQYFTVRDERFRAALATCEGSVKRWSANAVRVLDPAGRVTEAALPTREPHWVGIPGMDALPRAWAAPLQSAGAIEFETRVVRIARDALEASRWQLHTEGPQDAVQVHAGFDSVLLAVPAANAVRILRESELAPAYAGQVAAVQVAPCWTLMLAFPHAMQPGLTHLGPQWNAALSTHHRIAWLARESSKPGRSPVERWTVQASPAWSQEHFHDPEARVMAKLLKGFAEITGIRAEPADAHLRRWAWAKTQVPLGRSHLWDVRSGVGMCGDWCLGHRVEDAFVSGLELALAALAR